MANVKFWFFVRCLFLSVFYQLSPITQLIICYKNPHSICQKYDTIIERKILEIEKDYVDRKEETPQLVENKYQSFSC